MPNIDKVFREEVSRLAKRALRSEIDSLKKQVQNLRQTVREQKKEIILLKKTSSQSLDIQSQSQIVVTSEDLEEGKDIRISPDSVKRHRERLRLTQRELAQLLNVSINTVSGWEAGRSSPRGINREMFAGVRTMGVREVQAMLEDNQEEEE